MTRNECGDQLIVILLLEHRSEVFLRRCSESYSMDIRY